MLGVVVGDLKPWHSSLPRVLARCMAAGMAVPDQSDRQYYRRKYVVECMRGEDFEYDGNARMSSDTSATLPASPVALMMNAATGGLAIIKGQAVFTEGHELDRKWRVRRRRLDDGCLRRKRRGCWRSWDEIKTLDRRMFCTQAADWYSPGCKS